MSRQMELLVREEAKMTLKGDLSPVWFLLEGLRKQFHYGDGKHLEIRA